MKPLKLFMDARPGEYPENTYPYGKNGIQFDLYGAVINEPGFDPVQAQMPYTFIGKIETDSKPIIFSTDDTNSAIGFFNTITGLYEPIVDDNPSNLVNWPANDQRLEFSLNYYITGQAQRNYKGELVVAFTDKNKFPKYLNCDAPAITRLDDLRLFPYFSPPRIALTEGIGGSLGPGTYYVAIGYERNDGTSTPFSEVSQGLTIRPGELGGATDKAVNITISQADTSYHFMRVAIISRTNGKTESVLLSDWVPVTDGSIDLTYTGDNITEPITVQEILTPPAVYERVGTIGQLNDALYIADLEKEIELVTGLQQYVNMATVQWKSELIDATSPPTEHIQGQKKGLMHEEVYALYIRFHKTRGGYTKAFHLPGLPLQAMYDMDSTEAAIGGETLDIPRHKVEDCIQFFDATTKTGICGPWINENELYPDNDEFNSLPLGGADLRNESVRHHRMPSLRWCKNNLYASVPEYGKTKLDLLTLYVTNLNLPPDYDTLLDGYELLYAKRTPGNMTVYGQGALLHGAVSVPQVNVPTGNADIYTTGGNFGSTIAHKGKGDYNDDWDLPQLRQDTMRIHPFDVLLNKPSIEPTFISAQYRMRREKLRTEGYLEDGAHDGDHNMPTVHLIDYTQGVNTSAIPVGRQLRKVKTSFYLNQGITLSRFNNAQHETAFAGTLGGTNWPLNYGTMGYRIRGTSFTEASMIVDHEESYLVNLVAYKEDVYSPFYSQRLISAGSYKALDDFSPFLGWDTFVCDYTFHTYGRHDQIDTEGAGFKGKKVIRRIICESASNIHLRYEIPGNEYSRWYPRAGVAFNNPDQTYITKWDRSKEPNQFGYSKDLNALNDFVSSTIFNPFSEEITQFPYRVHRGGKLSRQNKPRSWRTFLPLDFYECQKNRGRIINVDGMYGRLIIHHEHAFFLTTDKAQLEAGLLSITLGSGDIFRMEPEEGLDSNLGYAGTIHDLACVKTPVGYVFVDGKQGEIFLWNGDRTPISLNPGVDTFFRDYLVLDEKNVYTGNGITIGWDQKYKRILLTVKNSRPPADIVVKTFENTDEFFDNLQVDDIVNYNGRFIKYKGINDPEESGFDCAEDEVIEEFAWEPYDFLCETEKPLSTVPIEYGDETNLISPAVLMYHAPSGRMYVGDHDNNDEGNFYRIHTVTGEREGFGSLETIYSFVKDRENNRIFGSAAAGGLKVFNIGTETIEEVNYGSNTALSRMGLWILGSNVVARDIATNTLTLVDRATLNLVATKNISTEIPSGGTWLTTRFQVLDVNGVAWIIPTQRTNGNIAVYSGDFSTLITNFALPAQTVVSDFGGDQYWQTGFYDHLYGKVYIHDMGSGRTHVLDKDTYAVLKTYTWAAPGSHMDMKFITDPINDTLYLCMLDKDNAGEVIFARVYIVDRAANEVTRVYMDTAIDGELERVGSTEMMWVAVPGNRIWEGGSWIDDGEIIQYAHGELPLV